MLWDTLQELLLVVKGQRGSAHWRLLLPRCFCCPAGEVYTQTHIQTLAGFTVSGITSDLQPGAKSHPATKRVLFDQARQIAWVRSSKVHLNVFPVAISALVVYAVNPAVSYSIWQNDLHTNHCCSITTVAEYSILIGGSNSSGSCKVYINSIYHSNTLLYNNNSAFLERLSCVNALEQVKL